MFKLLCKVLSANNTRRLFICLIAVFIRTVSDYLNIVFTAELYCPVRSFDAIIYICNTCNKHLSKNKMPCYALSNEMSLDSIPYINYENNIITPGTEKNSFN